MNLVGLIPARGGSKGIKDKNIINLNGKPLIAYSIEAAENSKLKKPFLSTDSQKITEIAIKYGIDDDYTRPDHLALDDTPMFPVILDFYLWIKAKQKVDGIVLLQPTSPLRTSSHIDQAIDLFINEKPTNVVSTIEVPHQYSPGSVMVEENGFLKSYLDQDLQNLSRQKKKKYYARNGPAILIISSETIENGKLYGDKILSYPMNQSSSVDIDSEEDLRLAEFYLENRKSNINDK